jgi:hypothetical protein
MLKNYLSISVRSLLKNKKLIHFGFGGSDYIGKIVGIARDHHQRSLEAIMIRLFSFPGRDFSGSTLE